MRIKNAVSRLIVCCLFVVGLFVAGCSNITGPETETTPPQTKESCTYCEQGDIPDNSPNQSTTRGIVDKY